MKEIAPGVFYCGLHDRNRKLFDQLVPLPQGTTYNSYLVEGAEKRALIDTMYEKLLGPYCDMIAARGAKIDYIVSNHAEPDHSGAIPTLLKTYPEAVVLCSPKCAENLVNMLGVDPSRIRAVADGEEVSLGGRTLKFIMAPWVHWPDTMFTHLVEDNFLFSCDYFGAVEVRVRIKRLLSHKKSACGAYGSHRRGDILSAAARTPPGLSACHSEGV